MIVANKLKAEKSFMFSEIFREEVEYRINAVSKFYLTRVCTLGFGRGSHITMGSPC